MIGRVIGNYRITGSLGSGGMGTVYKGIDQMVEREVAIKMLRPDIAGQHDLLQRFRAEAVTLAKVNHPNVATLYSFFNEGEEYFMVMEYVPGRNLDGFVRQTGGLPIEQAVTVFARAADGIAAAHEQGVLHRDIKPANIMVTDSGVVKVMDFGIARALRSSRMTRDGRIVGTVEYMAPERIEGKEDDARSDIYSLGVVLFELLAGRLPFISDSEFQLMRAHLSVEPPSVRELRQEIPEPIAAAVAKALAKRPGDRFTSVAGFRDAVLAGMPEGVELATTAQLAAAPVGPAAGEAGGPVIQPTRMAQVEEPAAPTRMAAQPAEERTAFSLAALGWKHYAVAASVLLVLIVAAWAALSQRGSGPAVAEEAGEESGEVEALFPEPAPSKPSGAAVDAGDGTVAVDEILGESIPIEGQIEGLITGDSPSVSGGQTDQPKPEAASDAERKRRALEALSAGGAQGQEPESEESKAERRRRALEALNQ